MGIDISFSLADLAKVLTPDELSALNGDEASQAEVLGGDVLYEYLTQEDDRVRPSHAALHGTVWRVDDPDAPTPPLDYGCRCFIRYCGAPDSVAGEILPVATTEPIPQSEAYMSYLSDNYSGWESIAEAARKVPPSDRMTLIESKLTAAGVANRFVKDVAYMILSVL